MRNMRRLAIAVVAGLWALPGPAQQMSDEELLNLFNAQRDAFRSAEESGMGRSRGLELITLDDAHPPSTETGTMAALPSTDVDQLATAPATGPDPSVPAGDESATVTAAMPDTLQPLVPEATPVVFGQLAPELQVNVRIEFAFDSAALSEEQTPKLDQLCRVMKASDIGKFRIVGHTDAAGSDAYNEKLSILRAREVQRYLVNECGIDAARLEAVGLGERFLFDPEAPRADVNRRVEFQALG